MTLVYIRSLPDMRKEWCKAPDRNLPVESLPQTDVIVCFHNEGWSVLIRTMHSILDRSPEKLIRNVILVDDASTNDYLKEELETYVAQYPKVGYFLDNLHISAFSAHFCACLHNFCTFSYIAALFCTFLRILHISAHSSGLVPFASDAAVVMIDAVAVAAGLICVG